MQSDVFLRPVREWATAGGGGTVRATLLGELTGIAAVVARVDLGDLALLSCNSSVVSISLDAPIRSSADVTALPYSLRATLGLPSDTLAGVGVAIVDSGISPASDVASRVSAFVAFTPGAAAAPLHPLKYPPSAVTSTRTP
jgi:hypothetical protein